MLNIRFHQVHQPSVDPGMIADGKCLCWSSMHRPAFVWLFREDDKLENVLRRKGLGIHSKRLPGMHSIFSLGCSNMCTCKHILVLHMVQCKLQLKMPEQSHSMSNFGLFFFFSSKWAEHVVSDLIESHSPVFFSAGLRFIFQLKRMQKTRWRFLQSVVKRAKQKKPIVFPNNETSEASCSRLFFAYVFTRKWSANQRKKIQGCDFQLNRRPHAKIQLIWTKKKTDQNST